VSTYRDHQRAIKAALDAARDDLPAQEYDDLMVEVHVDASVRLARQYDRPSAPRSAP